MFNVLIADSDVDAWFQINAILRRNSIKASLVSTLGAARQYIDRQLPALLFFDRHLQDNSMMDFIWYVRSKYPRAKIILINGAGDQLNNITSRADIIINKPLLPETIEAAIQKLVDPTFQPQ
ncbi:MAG: hypothetical protein ABIU63_10205 [Chitinophagaceae bacterium]